MGDGLLRINWVTGLELTREGNKCKGSDLCVGLFSDIKILVAASIADVRQARDYIVRVPTALWSNSPIASAPPQETKSQGRAP